MSLERYVKNGWFDDNKPTYKKITLNPILFKVLNRGRLEGAAISTFLCLLLFLLFGCSNPQKLYQVDEKLQPYVTQFEKIRNRKIDNLIVKFNKLAVDVLAQCTQNYTPLIEVNSFYIKEIANPVEVEIIMFHELGHCIIGRDHSKSIDSIMYPYPVPVDYYLYNYKLYISELLGIQYTKEFDESVYKND